MRTIKLKNGEKYTFRELSDFPKGPIQDAYLSGYVDGIQFVFAAEGIESDPNLKDRAKIAAKELLIGSKRK